MITVTSQNDAEWKRTTICKYPYEETRSSNGRVQNTSNTCHTHYDHLNKHATLFIELLKQKLYKKHVVGVEKYLLYLASWQLLK